MGIIRKFAAVGAVLAAAVLLFVVVCPIAPTPTAVVTARNTSPVTFVIFAAAFMLPMLVSVGATLAQFRTCTEARETLAPLTVLHRTCISLC